MALPRANAKGSLVVAALVDRLSSEMVCGIPRLGVRTIALMGCGVIEVVPDGTYQVHWSKPNLEL